MGYASSPHLNGTTASLHPVPSTTFAPPGSLAGCKLSKGTQKKLPPEERLPFQVRMRKALCSGERSPRDVCCRLPRWSRLFRRDQLVLSAKLQSVERTGVTFHAVDRTPCSTVSPATFISTKLTFQAGFFLPAGQKKNRNAEDFVSSQTPAYAFSSPNEGWSCCIRSASAAGGCAQARRLHNGSNCRSVGPDQMPTPYRLKP